MLTTIFAGALCAAGCSSTSFGVAGEDSGAEERTGVVEMLVDGGRDAEDGGDGGAVEGGDGGDAGEVDVAEEGGDADGGIPEAGTDGDDRGSSDAGKEHDGGGPELFAECAVDQDCFPADLDSTCAANPQCFQLFGFCYRGICTKKCGSTTGPCCEGSISCAEAVCRDFREISPDPDAAAVCTPPCTSNAECPLNHICLNDLCTPAADLPAS